MSVETLTTQATKSELEVAIQAAPDRVWSSLTMHTNAWWLPDFHMVGPGSVVELDARAGGGLVEHTEGGGSLLWYTVQMCQPGRSLHLIGHLAPEWGGPAVSMLELTLEEDGEGTRLRVRDALLGTVTEETARCQRDGWQALFGTGLRAHAEGA